MKNRKIQYRLVMVVLGMVVSTGCLEAQNFLLGADLSYANEMEDCGAIFYANDAATDIYTIMAENGAQVIRFRLWHNPDWTNYSNYYDVKKGINRAKEAGLKVLLDFHYSDTWTDPSKQGRPAAWAGITDLNILTDSLYQYTRRTLQNLKDAGLMPEYVQIGNEINGNIVCNDNEDLYPVNWSRQVKLLKAGIRAAKKVSADVKTVIHVTQPNNANWWFSQATTNGLDSFDIIGLSYYPEYHAYSVDQIGAYVKTLKTNYSKPVWIVETGYPWTLDNEDSYANILGEGSVLSGYNNPPTPNSQKNFLINLTYSVKLNGGMGVIYWEPDWVSTGCSTPWGTGSSYDNATFFDFENKLLPAIDFFTYDYSVKPTTTAKVTFIVDVTGVDITDGVFVTGDFTGIQWKFMPMTKVSGTIYKYTATIEKGSTGAYIYTNKGTWDNWTTANQETVPAECAEFWGTHRGYNIDDDTMTYAFNWGSCEPLVVSVPEQNHYSVSLYPNPAKDLLTIESGLEGCSGIKVCNVLGEVFYATNTLFTDNFNINISKWPSGIYLVKVLSGNEQQTIKFIKD